MSKLSDIFRGFEASLRDGQKRNENLYRQHISVVQELYQCQLKNLIKSWKNDFSPTNQFKLIWLRDQIQNFFGRDTIHFVAIDGTCKAEETTQFLLFYAGAYGARGSLDLKGTPPSLQYHKWSLEQDVSIVAQVPIPHAELEDILDTDKDPFAVSDFEKINLAGIHTLLMQLAEVYLAYDTVASSKTDAPDLVLLDQSISSAMAANITKPDAIQLIGSFWESRQLTEADVVVSMSHPFNNDLNIPTLKDFRQYTGLISRMNKNGGRVDLEKIASEEGIEIEDLKSGIEYLITRKLAKLENDNKRLTWIAAKNIDRCWSDTKIVFQEICTGLFVEKKPSALTYITDSNYVRKQRWMSPPDIKFLISVGFRMLIEECWKRKVLLVGLVKDSSSSYFTRNYLGVMRNLEIFPNLKEFSRPLPSTDRIALELVPLLDDTIESPWSTVEFDGVFMTMYLHPETNGKSFISGVRGNILAPERLTARSLGQFYLNRKSSGPLMGHVIFIERLLYPQWDKNFQLKQKIKTPLLGKVEPFFCNDINEDNIGQTIVMYLLSELTRNHFAEVIGYPDPLHKADWGAKTVGRRLAEMLKSVDYVMRSNPLSRTFRSIRDSVKR